MSDRIRREYVFPITDADRISALESENADLREFCANMRVNEYLVPDVDGFVRPARMSMLYIYRKIDSQLLGFWYHPNPKGLEDKIREAYEIWGRESVIVRIGDYVAAESREVT